MTIGSIIFIVILMAVLRRFPVLAAILYLLAFAALIGILITFYVMFGEMFGSYAPLFGVALVLIAIGVEVGGNYFAAWANSDEEARIIEEGNATVQIIMQMTKKWELMGEQMKNSQKEGNGGSPPP